jgi:hypothetical protein
VKVRRPRLANMSAERENAFIEVTGDINSSGRRESFSVYLG